MIQIAMRSSKRGNFMFAYLPDSPQECHVQWKVEVGFSQWNSFWIDTLHQQTFQSSCRSSDQKNHFHGPLFDSADLSILPANDFGITAPGISKEYGIAATFEMLGWQEPMCCNCFPYFVGIFPKVYGVCQINGLQDYPIKSQSITKKIITSIIFGWWLGRTFLCVRDRFP